MKPILIFFIFLWLLPLFCFSFLPFVDYPQHLAISHILHNYNNPEIPAFNQLFTLKFFPRAHILHTLFLHGASYLMPLEIAGKLFVSLIVILLPLSIYQFIKALGGNRWFTLLSFFFIYNYNLMWGFIAYCLGISIFFFTLTLLLKLNDASQDSPKAYVGLGLLFVLALLLHAQIYLLLLVGAVVVSFFAKNKAKEGAGRFCAIVPSFIYFLFCAYPLGGQKTGSILKNIFTPQTSRILQERFVNLPYYLFSGRPFDKMLFWLILAVFLGLIALRVVQARRNKSAGFSSQDKALNFLIAVFMLLYLFLPTDITGLHNLVAPRLAVFIPLLLIGFLSKVRLKYLTSLMVLTMVVLGMLFAGLLTGFYRFNAQAKPVRALLEKTEENKRLAELYTYPGDSGFFFHSFVHFGCYYTIRKDGLCGFIFPQKYNWHIVEVRKGANLPYVNVFDSWDCLFPKGWKNFDYFLICGKPSAKNEQWLKKAQLHLLGEEGIWRLYER